MRIIAWPSIFEAYLIFAQQGYENPQETTSCIICINCHLAKKPVNFIFQYLGQGPENERI